MMLVDKIDIKNYLPQREPMIMVDSLLAYNDIATRSSFSIERDNVLVEGDCLTEAGILENMAQTAALSKGYEYSLKNESPPLGFLGAVKKFIVHSLPKVDQRIETEMVLKHVVMSASIVEAKVFCDGELLASCELTIFINPKTN